MPKPKKEWLPWLTWFLDFINLDLNTLSPAEELKWAVEISALSQPHDLLESGFQPHAIRNEIIKAVGQDLLQTVNLQSFQDRLKDFFGFLMTSKDRLKNYSKKGWKTAEQTDFFPQLGAYETKNPVTVRLEARGNLYEKRVEPHREKTKHYYRWRPEAMDQATVGLIFEAHAKEDALLLHFVRALEGIPLAAFQECECGRWFIHLSKRERIYCSNLCASRYGARKRRGEKSRKNPQTYEEELRASADRAHNSYVKKIRKKHPRAIIKRRPYKHKTEEH